MLNNEDIIFWEFYLRIKRHKTQLITKHIAMYIIIERLEKNQSFWLIGR